jgi:hypothetical protein
MSKRIDSYKESRICEMYRGGMSMGAIRDIEGVSFTGISSCLDRCGVSKRSKRDYHPVQEDVFDSISEESSYWTGMLMADGNIYVSHKAGESPTITLSLKWSDWEHLEKLRHFLRSNNAISRRANCGTFPNAEDIASFRVRSGRLAAALSRYGVVPRKSKREIVSLLEWNRHFWRGMVDGDGWITDNNGYPIVGLTGSEGICEQFKQYVLKISPTCGSSITRNHSIWKVLITGRHAHLLLEELYLDCVVALKRKELLAYSWINTRREEMAAQNATKEDT